MKKWLTIALMLGVVGTLVPTVLGYGARFHYMLELCSHFRLQYAAAFISLIVGLAALRRWPWVVVATLGLTLDAVAVLPCYVGADRTEGVKPALTVLLANVHSHNRKTRPLLDLIAREKPDVVAILELSHDWQRRLAPLRKTHPHVVERAQRGNFGIALYSRLPILSSRIAKFSDPDLPSIVATLKLDARRSVRVIATHPVPPLHSRESAKLRDAHINKLADLASATRHLPLVVAGDLNATQFSPIFAKLLSRGRLRSARQGHGVLPSWPTSLWPMRIPLDHVLVNHRLRTLRVALGPDIGSDHLPLIARLGLTPEGELDN